MSRFREETIDNLEHWADELRVMHNYSDLEPIDYLLLTKLGNMLGNVATGDTDSDDVHEFLESAGF